MAHRDIYVDLQPGRIRPPRARRAGGIVIMQRRRPVAPVVAGITGMFVIMFASLTTGVVTAIALYDALAKRMPALEKAVTVGEPGAIPSLDSVSPWVIKATVSTEDANFYTNPGLNFKGLARALVTNLTGSNFLEAGGGSSITQQLVKNVLIAPDERYERSPERKIRETIYAIELTRRYTKDEILSWYLGVIYYGNTAIGIESASQLYFGKSSADLDLAEASFLAGIPQSPIYYDPFTNFDACKYRQADVLRLMAVHGYITFTEAQNVLDQPLDVVPPATTARLMTARPNAA